MLPNHLNSSSPPHQLHVQSPSEPPATITTDADVDAMDDGRCRICGDSVGCGLNFGCLSCESCKAFFRRCCSKAPAQHCPFSGNCKITKASRKACPACRLEKCLLAGMRREMVDAWKKHWTGRQKDQKRSYVEIRGKCQTKRLHILAEEEYGKRASGPLCNCGRVPMAVAEKGTQTEAPEPEPASLNAVDQAIMNELENANAIMETPLRLPHMLPFNLTLVDALRVSELAMRRLVGMFKQLAAFRSLDQRDQVTLLKGSLLKLLILRGAMAFDGHQAWRHAILITDGGQPLPFCLNFNILPAKEQHSEEHKRFLTTFGEEWRTNRGVMLILHAIVLFSPRTNEAAESLQAKDTVQQLRIQYCALLKRYLTVQCNARVDEAYSHLMGKLEELHLLNCSFQWLYSRLNPGELEPLLNELFSSASR